MKKILLALNALNPDKPAIEFASYLARLTQSKISAIFIENIIESKAVPEEFSSSESTSNVFAENTTLAVKYIELFKQGWVNREGACDVYLDRAVPATDLIKLSRFADALVIDDKTSFGKIFNGESFTFARDLLRKSECPVIIVPDGFNSMDEIVFAYNGSSSSVFSIKQFIYLFPQLYSKKVTVVLVDKTGEWKDYEKDHLTELLKGYYIDICFETIKGCPDLELFNRLFKRKNIFLVMGAYGRSSLSSFFKKSSAELIVKTVIQPIFIAHSYHKADS